MSELRRIGRFKDSGLSGGRVVLSDAEGDIRLVYRDGELYLHDKEPVGEYVAREVMPRLAGLQDKVEANQDTLKGLAVDFRGLGEELANQQEAYRDLEASMPLDRIEEGRLSRYMGKGKGYVRDGYVTDGFEGVTYNMTLGDVLRSSLLCLDVVESEVTGGVSRLSAELVSRDGLERRYLSLSRYKPPLIWNRISPDGKDRSGELDSHWDNTWRGRLFAEYSRSLLYEGTEFRCGMRKYDALLVYVSAKLQVGVDI